MPVANQKTGRPVNDLSGRRFGSYLVLRRGPDRSPFVRNGYRRFTTTWVCVCDCGRQTVRSSQQVKIAKRCLYCHNHTKYVPGKESARKTILSSYKKAAKYRGINWILSDHDFFALVESRCHYCGKLPSEDPKSIVRPLQDYRDGLHRRAFPFNGVDRIDSMGAYERSNVVACCKMCNHAKGTLEYGQFLIWINKLKAGGYAH